MVAFNGFDRPSAALGCVLLFLSCFRHVAFAAPVSDHNDLMTPDVSTFPHLPSSAPDSVVDTDDLSLIDDLLNPVPSTDITTAAEPSLITDLDDSSSSAVPSEVPDSDWGLFPPAVHYDVHPFLQYEPKTSIPRPRIKAALDGAYKKNIPFFAFTGENIDASQVAVWYANWTIEAQNDPAWSEMGEQKLFGHQFLGTDNLECGMGFLSCKNVPSLMGILELWPDKLELARKIYFIALQYTYAHDFAKANENALLEAHMKVNSITPSIIQRFTHQAIIDAELICKFRHMLKDTAVNAATTAVMAVIGLGTGAIIPPEALSGLSAMNAQISAMVGMPEGQTIPIRAFLKGLPGSEIPRVVGFLKDVGDLTPSFSLSGGYGTSGVCNDIGGDFKADNVGNTHRLLEYSHVSYQTSRDEMRGAIEVLNNGFVQNAGEPSLLALILTAKKWTGENSIVETLRDTRAMEYNMEHNVVMNFVSRSLAASYNYVKCTHRPDAENMAHDAEDAHKLGLKKASDPHFWGNYHYKRSFFRPEPDNDPTLLCQAVRYHMASSRAHEQEMDGWDNIADFAGGRYNLTWPALQKQMWRNFLAYGNTPGLSLDEMLSGRLGNGFWLPTCVGDSLKLTNYNQLLTGKHNRWNFPFQCGDWSGSETRGFLNLVNVGPGSQVRAQRGHVELYTDRFPRAVRKLSPVARYLVACEAGVRWPQKKGDKSATIQIRESDKDCDLVRHKTTGLSEFLTNKWFCEVGNEHTVFKREKGVTTTSFPKIRVTTHKGICKGWKKKNKGETVA